MLQYLLKRVQDMRDGVPLGQVKCLRAGTISYGYYLHLWYMRNDIQNSTANDSCTAKYAKPASVFVELVHI